MSFSAAGEAVDFVETQHGQHQRKAGAPRACKSDWLRLNGDGLLLGVGNGRGRHAFFSLARLADVDAALEEGTILDADALCDHITSQGAFAADVYPVAGIDVAAHLAQNHYFAGRDIRGHLSIATNRNAVARQVDGTLDLAVDVQRLGTGHFALDYQALANRGLVGSCRRCRGGAGGAGGG